MEIDAAPERGIPFRYRQARSTHGPVQLAGNLEQAVAHYLSFHPAGIHPPQVDVVPIDTRIGRAGSRIPGLHTIRVAGNHQSVKRFHTPVAVHEFGRQEIQQLRMRGPLSIQTEVEYGAYERLAEVARPDVIHGYAGRERI